MIDNRGLSAALTEMADLLEIQEANPFRVRAYRNASRAVAEQVRPLSEMVAANEDLKSLPGVGKDIAATLEELIRSGRAQALEDLGREIPRGVADLMRLPALGPKRARLLWQKLGIVDLDGLKAAADAGRIAEVSGFGVATQKKILESLERRTAQGKRISIAAADSIVAALLDHLRPAGAVRLEAAGSFRRRRETVGDLDLVAAAAPETPETPAAIMQRFVDFSGVESVVGRGDTKTSVSLRDGLQIDLRVVPERSFGAAWIYFTGSKDHNVKLRQRALERGMRLSEYGLFRGGEVGEEGPFAGEWVAGANEAEVYGALDLPWIPPELREDRGELHLAAGVGLPRLIELSDLRGDLQMHTTWSDGKNTLEEMARAALALGHEYIAVTDHGPALAMIRGLDADRVRLQAREVEAVQRAIPGLRILRSAEVDIRADGTLDLDDETLATLDVVLVSIHSRFDLPPEEQTRRILAALEHPLVQILAHPTGRKISRREGMRYDLDAVLRRAAQLGVAVECDSHPDRLDLSDVHLIAARQLGVPIVISTDAHRAAHLEHQRYGVEQARRAWLEPRHVLNTRPLAEFLGGLRPRR